MQSPSEDLPDATRNLIVALPPDMQLTLDNEPPTQQVKLSRCDIVVSRPTPPIPIEVNVVVNRTSYDLRTKETPKRNKATSTTRSHRSVSQNVSYVNLFQDSSSDDTTSEATTQPLGAAIKRELSHYRLAAHRYMLASRRGIITGPKVSTCASTFPKQEAPTNENTDSDATVIVEDNIKPPGPNKRKLPDITKNQETKPSKKHLLPRLTVYKKEVLPPNQRKKGGSHTCSSV